MESGDGQNDGRLPAQRYEVRDNGRTHDAQPRPQRHLLQGNRRTVHYLNHLSTDDFAYPQDVSAIYRSSATMKWIFFVASMASPEAAPRTTIVMRDIAAGTLDDLAQIPPDDHIWVNGMLPWLKFDDTLSRLPGSHWEYGYPDRN